jgi:potassium-transporting ATPase ATP-binding subunit
MTANGWLQISVFLLAILAATPAPGRFMTRVFNREHTWLDPVLRPLERFVSRSTGVDESREMRWTEYAVARTGTITFGNRQATEFVPLSGVTEREVADAAQLSSLADETPEGRSIVVLAKDKYGIRGREMSEMNAVFVPFTAQTRMSGVNLNGRQIRKGAADAIARYVAEGGGTASPELQAIVARIARAGGTPLVVADRQRPLGVVHLKDVVKRGIRERFAALRAMGIRTVMITGDNPLTAASIAAEAGVDDFLAEATPEHKMQLIRREQQDGKLSRSGSSC